MIEIATLTELQAMANDLAGHYRLVADIDASDTKDWNDGKGFTPVGDNQRPFTGVLDGNGHAISNIYICRAKLYHVGILGYSKAGEVRNLNVVAATVWGAEGVGALVGIGEGTINGCQVSGTVIGLGRFVGDLAGMDRCQGDMIGCTASVKVTGREYVGGLVGGQYSGDINNCQTFGEVCGENYVGGLVGFTDRSINKCQAFGWVNGTTETGGLVGESTGSVTSCRASGTVSGKTEVGGLVGRIMAGSITECLADGVVSGKDGVGGLVGISRGSNITKSYWDIETTAQQASAGRGAGGGEGRTSAQMKYRNTFVGWDFEKVWQIDEGKSYPSLRCFAPK